MGILSAIGKLFGMLMYFIYNTIGLHNYALSLVFFTIAYKLILLPLSIKQMKSAQLIQELQPELQRIQERYKHDREKLQEEQMKFYQEHNYNPASGCLPMLIQLPIIVALFYVIRMPMSYMLDIPARAVSHMALVSIQSGDLAFDNSRYNLDLRDPYGDDINDAYLQQAFKDLSGKDPYLEIKLLDVIARKEALVSENPYLSQEQKQILQDFDLKLFNFFNLGIKPTINPKEIAANPSVYLPALILLIIAIGTTFLTTLQLMPKQPESKGKGKDKKTANNGCANQSMLWMSPIMTLWIGLGTPSGLSFYWTLNNILSFGQQKLVNKFYRKDDKARKEDSNVAKVSNKRGKDS
ncbi:MAG: YidC/Oxa1 family membrane protein insertase [Clostridiaceae bacterium]|nr:YidC/Oxa1 family membrane protein insertase [Clostridiaceae bacterium]